MGGVYADYSGGAKHLMLALLRDKVSQWFEFPAPGPGRRFDFEKVDWENLYPTNVVGDVSREELPDLIVKLPAAATDTKGKGSGDPVDLAVVGNKEDLQLAFMR